MKRLLSALAVAGSSAACIDLFHATDFTTLCEADAAACTADAAAESAAPETTPSLCTTSALAQARGVCARLGACLGSTGSTRYAECLVQATMAYDCNANPGLRPIGAAARAWSCLAQASTCDAVAACVFPSGVQTCKPTEDGKYAACGNGVNATTLVECGTSETPVAVEPCLLSSRTCSTVDTTTNRGACTGVTGTGCVAGAKATCEGTAAVACVGTGGTATYDIGLDCGSLGAGRCVDATSGPACVPAETAAACAPDRGLACKGDVVSGCIEGRTLTLDCTALGLGCAAPRTLRGAWDIAAWCGPRDDAAAGCDPLAVDTCSGARLVSCLRGEELTLDCASVGLSACKVGLGGSGACSPAP